MSDIDPDLAPAEWDLANSNGAAASSSACADLLGQPPPPPAAVTTLPDQVFPDEHGRMKVMNLAYFFSAADACVVPRTVGWDC